MVKVLLALTAYATQFFMTDLFNTNAKYNLKKMKITKIFFRPVQTYRTLSFNVETNNEDVIMNDGQYYGYGTNEPSLINTDSTRYMKMLVIGDAGSNNIISYVNENNNYWDFEQQNSTTLTSLTIKVAFDGVYPSVDSDLNANNPLIVEIEFY